MMLGLFGYAANLSFNFIEESARKASSGKANVAKERSGSSSIPAQQQMLQMQMSSLEGIAEYYWGSKMKLFVQLNLIVLLFGALVTYLVLSSDNIVPVLHFIFLQDNGQSQDHVAFHILPFLLQRNVVILLSSLFVLPLCLAEELHALRQSSLLVLLCIGYVLCIVVYRATERLLHQDIPTLYFFNWNINAFYSFSVQSLAFCCQFNILPLYSELQNPTRKRMNIIKRTTIVVCVLVFSLFGLLGYIAFGEDTPGDILTAFDDAQHNPWVAIGRLLLGLSLLLKCPLVLHPLRLSIIQIVHEHVVLTERVVTDLSLENTTNTHHEPSKTYGKWILMSLAIAILTPAAFLAISIPKIQQVYSLLGSTAGGMICFMIPGLIFLKAMIMTTYPQSTRTTRARKQDALKLLTLGSISIVASLYVSCSPQQT